MPLHAQILQVKRSLATQLNDAQQQLQQHAAAGTVTAPLIHWPDGNDHHHQQQQRANGTAWPGAQPQHQHQQHSAFEELSRLPNGTAAAHHVHGNGFVAVDLGAGGAAGGGGGGAMRLAPRKVHRAGHASNCECAECDSPHYGPGPVAVGPGGKPLMRGSSGGGAAMAALAANGLWSTASDLQAEGGWGWDSGARRGPVLAVGFLVLHAVGPAALQLAAAVVRDIGSPSHLMMPLAIAGAGRPGGAREECALLPLRVSPVPDHPLWGAAAAAGGSMRQPSGSPATDLACCACGLPDLALLVLQRCMCWLGGPRPGWALPS